MNLRRFQGRFVVLIASSVILTGGLIQTVGARQAATGNPFTAAEFSARRARVYQAIGGDIAVLYGMDEPDNYRRHRQHNNFYYLSGVEIPGAALLLDGRSKKATIFGRIPPPTATSIQKTTGIDEIKPLSAFSSSVKTASQGRKRVFLPRWPGEGNAQARDSFRPIDAPLEPLPGDRRTSRVLDFRNGIKALTGPLQIVDLETVIDPLRRVKSPAEIAVMREAGRIGAVGIADAIRATRPGILERELEGVCELAFLKNGAHASAWTSIVATGPNITNFHYFDNSRRIQSGDMVLIDAGPDYNYYCSDITRVWPATGPYPPRYKELYDKLLAVHRATIAAVKPGVTSNDLNRALVSAAKAQGIDKYVIPFAGHYTGMAPHDVGDYSAPFVPGVVFNVEPLLVIAEEGIHIRFEDTILCTPSGRECLIPLDVLPWEREKLLAIRDGKASSKKAQAR